MVSFNYKYFYYFWMVVKIGGVVCVSEWLYLIVQIISGQISLFEEFLGYKFFKCVGWWLEFNDEGCMVFDYVECIFSFGEELEEVLCLCFGGCML